MKKEPYEENAGNGDRSSVETTLTVLANGEAKRLAVGGDLLFPFHVGVITAKTRGLVVQYQVHRLVVGRGQASKDTARSYDVRVAHNPCRCRAGDNGLVLRCDYTRAERQQRRQKSNT